jgi:hypothetical protein
VVAFTPRYPPNRRVGGSQRRHGRLGERKVASAGNRKSDCPPVAESTIHSVTNLDKDGGDDNDIMI